MSKDLQLLNRCDHLVAREPLLIDEDMRTVVLMRSTSASNLIQLFLNNNEIFQNNTEFGWSLVQDENSVDRDKKNIQFNNPLKSSTDIIEVSYYTNALNCRKCHSYKIYDDIAFSAQGNIVLVDKENKLVQDIEKIVITIIESNTHHPWYGTRLLLFLGSANDPHFFRVRIASDINDSLENLINMQEQQFRVQRIYMDDEEQIDSIENIDVWEDENDPTRINVSVTVRNKASQLIDINKVIQS